MPASTLLAGLLSCLLLATGAEASAPPSPWDGTNPFNCTLQNAGRGTTVPDPGADPYCVYFDKTNQNVTELGLVEFLSLEPARTAAAYPKCFYFQSDHWRGSIVQSDGSTELYEFYGHYFFDKATGDGGVWVTGFNVNHQTFDPSSFPGFPPSDGQYFGPGTGGFITHDQVPADPTCVAIAKAHPGIYASASRRPRCLAGRGTVTRRGIGSLKLGMTEQRVRAFAGSPQAVKRGFLHYCVTGGGTLLIGEPGDRSGTLGPAGHARVVMLLTAGRGFVLRWHRHRFSVGARPGRRAWRSWRTVAHVGGLRWLRRGNLLAAVRGRRVAWLGAYDRRRIRTTAALRSYLHRARP